MKLTNNTLDDFVKGDMAAFKDIYEATKDFMYNLIYKMVLNSQEAEDLTHDVYIKIYEKRKMYNKEYSINTWVNKIALNHVLNHLKRKQNIFSKLNNIYYHFQNSQKETDISETEDNVALNLLSQIDIKYRTPIILKDIQEVSYEEIAKIMVLPIGTIRSRLNRGRAKLKELYIKEVKDEKL
jgi:RNA polymerase sigma-70 factor, ECF subfamily